MNTASVWRPVNVKDVRIGDRIRARSRLYDSVHEFTVREVSQDYGNWVADGVFTYGTFPTAVEVNERFEFAREYKVPTTPGLYRLKNKIGQTGVITMGLVLDTFGDWWWYDLSCREPMVLADLEQVHHHIRDMVLADAWDHADRGGLT